VRVRVRDEELEDTESDVVGRTERDGEEVAEERTEEEARPVLVLLVDVRALIRGTVARPVSATVYVRELRADS